MNNQQKRHPGAFSEEEQQKSSGAGNSKHTGKRRIESGPRGFIEGLIARPIEYEKAAGSDQQRKAADRSKDHRQAAVAARGAPPKTPRASPRARTALASQTPRGIAPPAMSTRSTGRNHRTSDGGASGATAVELLRRRRS